MRCGHDTQTGGERRRFEGSAYPERSSSPRLPSRIGCSCIDDRAHIGGLLPSGDAIVRRPEHEHRLDQPPSPSPGPQRCWRSSIAGCPGRMPDGYGATRVRRWPVRAPAADATDGCPSPPRFVVEARRTGTCRPPEGSSYRRWTVLTVTRSSVASMVPVHSPSSFSNVMMVVPPVVRSPVTSKNPWGRAVR